MERDTGVAPVTSPWQGDELLLHQTRNKQHSALTVKNLLAATTNEINVTKPCESFNSQLINVVGAPNGSRNRIYSFGPRIKT